MIRTEAQLKNAIERWNNAPRATLQYSITNAFIRIARKRIESVLMSELKGRSIYHMTYIDLHDLLSDRFDEIKRSDINNDLYDLYQTFRPDYSYQFRGRTMNICLYRSEVEYHLKFRFPPHSYSSAETKTFTYRGGIKIRVQSGITILHRGKLRSLNDFNVKNIIPYLLMLRLMHGANVRSFGSRNTLYMLA